MNLTRRYDDTQTRSLLTALALRTDNASDPSRLTDDNVSERCESDKGDVWRWGEDRCAGGDGA